MFQQLFLTRFPTPATIESTACRQVVDDVATIWRRSHAKPTLWRAVDLTSSDVSRSSPLSPRDFLPLSLYPKLAIKYSYFTVSFNQHITTISWHIRQCLLISTVKLFKELRQLDYAAATVFSRTLLRYVRLMVWAVRLSSVALLHSKPLELELFGNILHRLIAQRLGQFVLKFWAKIRRVS